MIEVPLSERTRPTVKSRIFNVVRLLLRFEPVDRLIAKVTMGRDRIGLFKRLPPKVYQYPRGTVRVVERAGIRYRLDLAEYVDWFVYFGFRDAGWERFSKMLRPGSTVLDVGANIGYMALRMGQAVGPEGTVVAFEPFPETLSRLETNLSLNESLAARMSVRGVALGRAAGTVSLGPPAPGNLGRVRVAAGTVHGATSVTVSTVDAEVTSLALERVDAMKIDVEGFELQVLEGARETLERWGPCLFIELIDSNLRDQSAGAREVVELLTGMGYELTEASSGASVRPGDSLKDISTDVIAVKKP